MKIAIIGCGAIGGLFLGYLQETGADILGVVKKEQKESFAEQGLFIEGVRGKKNYKVAVDTEIKEKVNLAIFATKINDLEKVAFNNLAFLKDSYVLTTQNGIRADYILNQYFPKERIITSIVMFGATFYPPNRVVHNFEGDLILGSIFSGQIKDLANIKTLLQKAFKVSTMENIKGAKYLKIFINLNNALAAILGIPMQEAFSDLDIAEVAIALNREAYTVVRKSNIELKSLPTYPKEKLEGLVAMEKSEAAKLFSKIMTSLSDKPLYGSILQSIKRARKSEIDYINGEIVKLAKENKIDAPLNKKIVALVHKIENSGKFFTKKELLEAVRT